MTAAKINTILPKGKSKDATAASGHLLCKFFQTIYTCMSERSPQNAGCGVDIMKNQELIQAKLILRLCSGENANSSIEIIRNYKILILNIATVTTDSCILSNTLLKVKLLKMVFLIPCLIAKECLV